MKHASKPIAFLDSLKSALNDVMKDKKATVAERLRAIEVAAKLVMIEHKVKGDGDDESKFFR